MTASMLSLLVEVKAAASVLYQGMTGFSFFYRITVLTTKMIFKVYIKRYF